MHAIALGGCTDTVRDRICTGRWLGENSLAASGTRTRVSIAPGFSVGRSTNRTIPTEVCTKIKTGRFKPNVRLHGRFVAPSQSVVLLTIARSVANVIQNGSLPRHRTQLATMVHYVQYSYLSWRRGKKSVTVWDSRTFALSTVAYKEARRPVMPPFAFYLKGSLFLPHCRIGGRRLKWVLDDSNKLRQVVQLAEFAQSRFVSHFVQSQ